jgi:uncharacterized damage-inducible protein DinB
MKTLIDELSYNRWANLRLIETSVELDTKRFMQRVESSFPSVQKTWIHIIWAEELWYERWNSRSFITEYSSDDFPTVESIRNKIEVLSANQLQYIKILKPEDAEKKISYENIKGEKWEYSLSQMVHHMFVHSVYHRGQIVTMLRQLGLQPPGLDYLVYVDEMAQ